MVDKKIYYIAYGSNLNVRQMSYRCQTAKSVGTAELKDYELQFKGREYGAYASVEPVQGSRVSVLLWDIKAQDEMTLDMYEGYPNHYRKEFLDVELKGERVSAMMYVMNRETFGCPSSEYFNIIKAGYQDCGFDLKELHDALDKSVAKIIIEEQVEIKADELEDVNPDIKMS